MLTKAHSAAQHYLTDCLWRSLNVAMETIIAALRRLLRPSAASHPAYKAGFQAGQGQLCPYRDPEDVDRWYAGRADHDRMCEDAW